MIILGRGWFPALQFEFDSFFRKSAIDSLFFRFDRVKNIELRLWVYTPKFLLT